jgi:hypothetical protein
MVVHLRHASRHATAGRRTIDTEDTDTKAQEEAEAKLLLQIAAEHALCDDPTWRNKQLKRLKIYNQARDESKVGDPLLFTVFQTVFAALYDDRLSVVFEGNDEGDTDTAENLTDLAEHDYRVMQKDEADCQQASSRTTWCSAGSCS